MRERTRYAIIEHESGYIWWVGDAADPIDACRKCDRDNLLPADDYKYQEISRPAPALFCTLYHVHAAPDGYDVDDGQNAAAIRAVRTLPLAAHIRVSECA